MKQRFTYLSVLLVVAGLCAAFLPAPQTPTPPTPVVPMPEATRPTLYYCYDPLCGWCFGFSPVMKRLAAEFGNDVDIQVISGGLAIGPNRRTMAELRQYIGGSLPRLEQTTGVTFGEGWRNLLFTQDSVRTDSEPPCIALTVAKEMKPEIAVAFAHALQDAYFKDGNTLTEPEHYRAICQQFGLEYNTFITKWQSTEAHTSTYQEFERANQLGAQGFPTLVWQGTNGRTQVLTRGYARYEDIEPMLRALVAGGNGR